MAENQSNASQKDVDNVDREREVLEQQVVALDLKVVKEISQISAVEEMIEQSYRDLEICRRMLREGCMTPGVITDEPATAFIQCMDRIQVKFDESEKALAGVGMEFLKDRAALAEMAAQLKRLDGASETAKEVVSGQLQAEN